VDKFSLLEKIAKKYNKKPIDKIEKILNRINIMTFGIEFLKTPLNCYEYINMGETYAITILQNIETKETIVSSWGDILEEETYCQGDNLIQCIYCGRYMLINEKDYTKTICESCKNDVG